MKKRNYTLEQIVEVVNHWAMLKVSDKDIERFLNRNDKKDENQIEIHFQK